MCYVGRLCFIVCIIIVCNTSYMSEVVPKWVTRYFNFNFHSPQRHHIFMFFFCTFYPALYLDYYKEENGLITFSHPCKQKYQTFSVSSFFLKDLWISVFLITINWVVWVLVCWKTNQSENISLLYLIIKYIMKIFNELLETVVWILIVHDTVTFYGTKSPLKFNTVLVLVCHRQKSGWFGKDFFNINWAGKLTFSLNCLQLGYVVMWPVTWGHIS